ncbi:NAD(P)-binding protein [Coprinopsis marcescibilis]|uniref:NAD(P)-binding protein n=1 Tax=Coprinopsis marcescibilis TaxID=230819 RepID=A0A5C3KFM2_COPMA|nr:NAD(P)-binding protein [Coprinopsis marcescibilis]
MSKNVVIIGGHGKVALKLTRLLTNAGHKVTSVIRTTEQEEEIKEAGATPHVLSLEDALADRFTSLFIEKAADVVYFTAGAGGKGGEDRTKKVDFEGAVKIYDSIEGVEREGGKKNPHLILVSAVDIRNPDKIPEHYDESDRQMSERIRKVIASYMHWKYEADKNLIKRDAFSWSILRPGGLSDAPGTGKASIGRTHLSPVVSRDDVSLALFLLLDRQDANKLAIDFVGGDIPVSEGLDAFIARGVTDWLG